MKNQAASGKKPNPPPPVNWARYFDRIYCFTYTGQAGRRKSMLEELVRVGITDSGVLTEVIVTPDPYDKVIGEKLPRVAYGDEANTGFVSIGLASARTLREALFLGYEKVLFLESDARFLRDTETLGRLLSETPEGYDLVQYDNFWEWNDDHRDARNGGAAVTYGEYVRAHRIGDTNFVDGGGDFIASGACFMMNRAAMEKMLARLEEKAEPMDGNFGKLGVKRAFADTNLAVQIAFTDALFLKYFASARNTHHNAYRAQGIDYSRYAVPDGYGYGTLAYDPAADALVPQKPEKLRISVYAIAKNEEKFVDRWMDSMSEADEVVVLDTGSEDGTVEKLKARGAKVSVKRYEAWKSVEEYDRIIDRGGTPWRFDTARNDSMELVSPDADILVCTDLDEVLDPGWRAVLETEWKKAVAAGKNPTTASYRYIWSFRPDGTPDLQFTYEKIHAPKAALWAHPVHEVLDYGGKRGYTVELPGVVLKHYPDGAKSRANYLPYLEMSVRECPEDDRNMHYLGREYMYRGKWDAAIRVLVRHLNLPNAKWRAERAQSMRFIARCLDRLGKREASDLWFYRAMDEDPGQRESAVEFAQTLYCRESKNWPGIRAACERALRTTVRLGTYLTESDAWGPKPHDLLSLALWNLGDKAGSLREAKAALALAPDDERLRKNKAVIEENM